MNRLNAKRIGVLAASLLLGLAVAGPVSFSSIPIINSAGQPVVQIVIGSSAKPSDGVVAANIAAVIGNLAFTSTPVSATVGNTNGLSCVVTTAKCAVSNQQVWLGESGVSAPSGSYGFTALIGSVLNRAITLGSPSNTKSLQSGVGGSYAFQRGYTTSNSPQDSPYTAAGYVPTSTSVVAATNGGGVSFSSFTASGATQDNLIQITNAQLPALLGNSGNYGENEYLWLTGFPVYDQQTSPSVQNFALIDAGGAYQITFNKPIHEPYWALGTLGGTGTPSVGNSINNAAISLLGQQWTIVNYALPTGTPSSSTVALHGGKLSLAASLVPMTTVYVGKNLTSGPFTVQLADLGTANSGGTSPAAINIYYKGVLTNSSSIWPVNTVKYNVTGVQLYVKVNATFAGLYAYQKWAKIQLYSNVYNLTDGQTFNQTRDPGWNVNLLWVNASGSGHFTDLQSIIIYNSSSVTLTPGQSFTFIQNPQTYKLTLVGDTNGNNFDAVSITSQYASSIQYKNLPSGSAPSTGNGLGNINNVTEPAQELIVTSQIPNAFSYAGQTSSSVTYLLTPYALTESRNSISANAAGVTSGYGGNGYPVNVEVQVVSGYPTANYISSSNPLLITISGFTSNVATSAQSTTLTFTSVNMIGSASYFTNAMQATSGNFYNITAIKLSRALPGLSITVGTFPGNAVSATANCFDFTGAQVGNVMASLATTTTPQVIYPASGQVYSNIASGATVTYNQQNGQPTGNFAITGMSPVPKASTGVGVWGFFTYNVPEIDVPANTGSTDSFSFNIMNSTAGASATPLFQLNYSATNTWNNVTYTSAAGTAILAKTGFVSERGSKVATISPTVLTFDIARNIDMLQLVVGPVNATVTTSGKQVGPYGVGQTTNIPNVTIANVTQTTTVTGAGSGCTVSGTGNLTATPSVTSATTPVKLDTSATPLVVMDSNANAASTLIVVGSKFVNTVAQQIFAQNPSLDSSFGTSSVVLQAFGSNRILVAGYYANQTVQAGNQFIQALLSAA
jgi:hypothetical protein